METYTDLLYAQPSFLGGMATALDMHGTLVQYNDSEMPDVADFRALRSDWRQVGADLRHAIDTVVGQSAQGAAPRPGRRRGQRR